jgi:5-methyltetrahydropteroyltriglutamate--homocysteine methyltransferase
MRQPIEEKTMTHIQTTHVGSLPRSEAVTDQVYAAERGEAVDPARFDAVIGDAVDTCVARQVAAGVDLVSDGEMSKITYATYIKDRITGFDGDSPPFMPGDFADFPGFVRRAMTAAPAMATFRRPRCIGPIAPLSDEPLNGDIARFKAALEHHPAKGAFMNAASPGVIALFQPNEYYATHDEYLEALAEAMRPEYEAIVAAGFTLQLDSPDVGVGRHTKYADRSDADYLTLIGGHIEALNHALRNIPAEAVRMHICWGNYEGPHHCDVEMSVILPTLMQAKPQGLLFETANPRHQHDWRAFGDAAALIPEDRILIPGVIDTTTNFIEHPEVVAQRIEMFTRLVGKERVIAGTDCGFSTFAGVGPVEEGIVYAKLASLSEGAAIASVR